MILSELISTLTPEFVVGSGDVTVRDIVFDSRKIQKNSVFVASVGETVDGHTFIEKAITAGAGCVIGERFTEPQIKLAKERGVSLVRVGDSKRDGGVAVAAYYGFPSQKMVMIGVTGTDGKTTTSTILYYLLKKSGKRVGLISTISAKYFDGTEEREYETGFHVTTPEVVDVHRYLNEMVTAGCEYAVVESTSHAFAQERLAGINFDVGVVTNITHEHLDYHKTIERYIFAKSTLFRVESALPAKQSPRIAVINQDDKAWEYLKPYTEDWNRVGYGFGDFCMYRVVTAKYDWSQTEYVFQKENNEGNAVDQVVVKMPLLGQYNVYNSLAAIAALTALGFSPESSAQYLQSIDTLPGRFERFETKSHGTVVVDFAHTPNALEQLLRLAREITTGRVLLVFGSAGLRDIEKRYLMGEVGGNMADIAIITAEDPRTESVSSISNQIAEGAIAAGAEEFPEDELVSLHKKEVISSLEEHYPLFVRIEDRGTAIETAIRIAREGDLVLVCGKGHEQSMCFGSEERPWSDQNAVRSSIKKLES